MGKRVTQEEIQFIIDNFDEMTIVDIASHLGRRPDHIGGIARKHGLRKLTMVPWTLVEEEIIKEFFPNFGAKMCKHLLPNRTVEQIHWKAKRLGVYCNITRQRINYGIKKHDLPKGYSIFNGYLLYHDYVNDEQYFVHRRKMEDFLGRKLTCNEVVHHKDQNKLNNDINNLEVLTRAEHARLHKNLETIY